MKGFLIFFSFKWSVNFFLSIQISVNAWLVVYCFCDASTFYISEVDTWKKGWTTVQAFTVRAKLWIKVHASLIAYKL